MPERSFVETLDLATDERLRTLRPRPAIPDEAGLRRGGPAAPEAIGDNLRAAVDAGSDVASRAEIPVRQPVVARSAEAAN